MIKKLRAPNGMVDVLQDLSMVASASYFSPATKLLPEEGGRVCVCVCAWSGKLVWIQIFSPVFRSRVSRRAPLVNDPNETSVA